MIIFRKEITEGWPCYMKASITEQIFINTYCDPSTDLGAGGKESNNDNILVLQSYKSRQIESKSISIWLQSYCNRVAQLEL